MNIVQNLVLKFMDYMRPSYTAFGGQFEGLDARNAVYVKVDRKLYFQDNLGVEYCLSHPGSVDADLLDGLDSTDFSLADHWHYKLNGSDGDPVGAVSADGNGLALFTVGLKSRYLSSYHADVELGNGQNDNVAPSTTGAIYITGPTSPFSITGIANGVPEQLLVIHNRASANMTLKNGSLSSQDINRMYCPGGTDAVTVAQGWALLFYSRYAGGVGGWLVLSIVA